MSIESKDLREQSTKSTNQEGIEVWCIALPKLCVVSSLSKPLPGVTQEVRSDQSSLSKAPEYVYSFGPCLGIYYQHGHRAPHSSTDPRAPASATSPFAVQFQFRSSAGSDTPQSTRPCRTCLTTFSRSSVAQKSPIHHLRVSQ